VEESRSQRIAIGAALLAWLTVGYGAWSGIFGEGAGLGFALSWGLYGAFMLAVIFGSRWLTGIPRHIALSALVVLGVVTVWTMPASGFNIAMLVLTASMIADEWRPPIALGVIAAQSVALGFALHLSAAWPEDDLGSIVGMIGAFLAFQLFAYVMVIALDSAEKSRAELARANDELAQAHRELQATQARLVASGKTEERLRIARDLHDTVGHQLTALAVNLEAAGHLSTGPERDRVLACRDLSRELLAEVRGVVASIRLLPTDLRAELDRLASGLSRPIVHVDVADDVPSLDPVHVEALLRCAQESVTNAARHGNAATIWIAVEELAGSVTLTARDDGPGVDAITPGHGLLGMRERFQSLGGEVTWSSRVGRGFHVEASLPLAAR